MTLSNKNGRYTFLVRLDLIIFCVTMKRVPIITNFKRLIYQTLIKLILNENDAKLLKF